MERVTEEGNSCSETRSYSTYAKVKDAISK